MVCEFVVSIGTISNIRKMRIVKFRVTLYTSYFVAHAWTSRGRPTFAVFKRGTQLREMFSSNFENFVTFVYHLLLRILNSKYTAARGLPTVFNKLPEKKTFYSLQLI